MATVGRITVGPGGTLVVADTRDLRLVVFDSTGSTRRTVGRRGSGPGEFQSITAFAWQADTLIVLDLRQRRLVALLPETGSIVNTIMWPDTLGWPTSLLNAGSRVFASVRPRLPTAQVVSTVIKGSIRTTYAPNFFVPITARSIGSPSNAPRDSTLRPSGWACEDSKGTVNFDGAFYDWRGPASALTRAGDLVSIDSSSFRIHVQPQSPNRAVRILERVMPLRRLTNAEWDSIARPLSKYAGQACDPPIQRPAAIPYLRAIATDEQDRIWLETTGHSGYDMHVLSLDGQPIGQFTIPARDVSVAWYVRSGRLYMVQADNDGVLSIQVLRVLPD